MTKSDGKTRGVCVGRQRDPGSSKELFLLVWKWVKHGLTSGPFQPQPIAYDDLHTQPVPCCYYPISFGLRPTLNQALWSLTESEAYDLLLLIAILRGTCFCGTNTARPSHLTATSTLSFFQLPPPPPPYCSGSHIVYQLSTHLIVQIFHSSPTITSNYRLIQQIKLTPTLLLTWKKQKEIGRLSFHRLFFFPTCT